MVECLLTYQLVSEDVGVKRNRANLRDEEHGSSGANQGKSQECQVKGTSETRKILCSSATGQLLVLWT